MPDSPLSDPRISNKTPKAWAQQLQGRVQGHALWHATPAAEAGGSVGDCGYIDGGRFIKLFNIFDAHNDVGIEPNMYRLRSTDIRSESKENVFPLSYSSRIRTIDLGMNLQTGPLQLPPPINATLSATVLSERESIAFLAFCGPTTTTSRYDKTRLLENYMIAEHLRILAHYGVEHPVELNNLLIIQGTKTSASWLGGLASGRQHGLRAESSVGGIGASGRMFSLEENGWSVTQGNRFWDSQRMADSEPCIVIKPIKMRARERMISRLSTLVGIPGRQFNSQPWPSFSNGAQMSGNPSYGSVMAPSLHDSVFYYPSADGGRARSNSRSDRDQSDEPLLDDQTDLLDELLDFVLDSWPNARYVVGSWDIIETFVQVYGGFPENWQTKNVITAVVEACYSEPHCDMLRVISIQLRTLQPVVCTTKAVDKSTVRPPGYRKKAQPSPSRPPIPVLLFEPAPFEVSRTHDVNSCSSGTTLADEAEPVPPSTDEKEPGRFSPKTQEGGRVAMGAVRNDFPSISGGRGKPNLFFRTGRSGDAGHYRLQDLPADEDAPGPPSSHVYNSRGPTDSISSKLAKLGIRVEPPPRSRDPGAGGAKGNAFTNANAPGGAAAPPQRVPVAADFPALRGTPAPPQQPKGRGRGTRPPAAPVDAVYPPQPAYAVYPPQPAHAAYPPPPVDPVDPPPPAPLPTTRLSVPPIAPPARRRLPHAAGPETALDGEFQGPAATVAQRLELKRARAQAVAAVPDPRAARSTPS